MMTNEDKLKKWPLLNSLLISSHANQAEDDEDLLKKISQAFVEDRKDKKYLLKKCNLTSFKTIEYLTLSFLHHDDIKSFEYLINKIPENKLAGYAMTLINRIMLNNMNYNLGNQMNVLLLNKIKSLDNENLTNKNIKSHGGSDCPLNTALLLENFELADLILDTGIYSQEIDAKKILCTVISSSKPKTAHWFYNKIKSGKLAKINIFDSTWHAIERCYSISKSGQEWLELNKEEIFNSINNLMQTHGYVRVYTYKGRHDITKTAKYNDGFHHFLSAKEEKSGKIIFNLLIKHLDPNKSFLNHVKKNNFEMASMFLPYTNSSFIDEQEINISFDFNTMNKLNDYPKLKSLLSKKDLKHKMADCNFNVTCKRRVM